MGYSSKQVSVGALINPTEGLSRSLTNLSNTFGRQAESQQRNRLAEAATAESARRFDVEQNRLIANKKENDSRWAANQKSQKIEQDHKSNSRAALELTNKWQAGIHQGNVKYRLDDYSAPVQEQFGIAKKHLEAKRASTEKFLNSGLPADLENSIKLLGNATPKEIEERKFRLNAFRNELNSYKTPEERQNRLDTAMSGLYKDGFDAIENEIASGNSLVKRQKQAAIMRTAPEEALKYGDYSAMSRTVGDTLSGQTEKGLLADEKISTQNTNAANLARFNKGVTAANASNRVYKSKGSSKVLEILKFEAGSEYGPVDEPRVKKAISLMIADKIDEDSIALAIALGTTKDEWAGFGDYFMSTDSKEYTRLHALAKSLSEGKKNNNGKFKEMPTLGTPKVARTLDQIQKDQLIGRTSVSRKVLDVGKEYLKRKEKLITPTVVSPRAVAGESSYADNSYVPESSSIPDIPTPMHKYILGSGNTFGTNSGRLEQLLDAGIPRKLAHKAANNRKKLTDNERSSILEKLPNITPRDRLTSVQKTTVSNIRAGLERGMKKSDFTEYEQKLFPKILGINKSRKIGRDVLNLKADDLKENRTISDAQYRISRILATN